MPSTIQIESIILSALRELGQDLGKPELENATADTAIFGPGGALDSLALVHLIADIEGRVADKLGLDIVIADERAMSQTRGPFRTVATLTEYVSGLVNDGRPA